MHPVIKIIIYVVILISTLVFGGLFYKTYNTVMDESADSSAMAIDEETPIPEIPAETQKLEGGSNLSFYGGGFFVSVIVLALFGAHDIASFLGTRAMRGYYSDEMLDLKSLDYEKGEELWAQGEFVEAINLMRAYLKKNPREQHVALRIAEIYEKDLNNPLAAALEYEEILTHKLAKKRWGWAAIHLCNLYFRLNQNEKAVALLNRIVEEYGDTPAAEKARKRLALLAGEEYVEPSDRTDSADDSRNPPPSP